MPAPIIAPTPIIVTLKPDILRLRRTSSVPGRYPGAVALIRSFRRRESFWCQDTPRVVGRPAFLLRTGLSPRIRRSSCPGAARSRRGPSGVPCTSGGSGRRGDPRRWGRGCRRSRRPKGTGCRGRSFRRNHSPSWNPPPCDDLLFVTQMICMIKEMLCGMIPSRFHRPFHHTAPLPRPEPGLTGGIRGMRKKLTATAAILLAGILAFFLGDLVVREPGPALLSARPGNDPPREIVDTGRKGETVAAIFETHPRDIGELFRMREASAGIHRLRDISVGMPYTITLDPDNNVLSLAYHINDEEILRIVRLEPGYRADKVAIGYERRIGTLGGVIESNLVSSLPGGGQSALLAIALSDIFAWDIDFNTDF